MQNYALKAIFFQRLAVFVVPPLHHHRFKPKTSCCSPNLFHVTVAGKNLGFNRHKTRLRQLVYVTFEGAGLSTVTYRDGISR